MVNKTKIKTVGIIIIIILVFAGFFDFVINAKGNYSSSNYFFDTYNEVTILNEKKFKSKKALKEVDKLILKINNEMSAQLPGSEITQINDNAGKKAVHVSDDVFSVIQTSIDYSKKTKNTFDISIGCISSMWNIGNEDAKVPSKWSILNELNLVNYNNIEIDKNKQTVKLKKEGMKIDVGAIAKGFAADKIVSLLKENHIKDAIINLGGNVYIMGKNQNNKYFNVGIQNPNKPVDTENLNSKKSRSLGSIALSNKSVVTSGIYERFIESNGKVYHHMINPKTGYPFDNKLVSVTIISDKSIDGDALSTAVFGMGLDNGYGYVNTLDNTEAIFVTKDNKIYLSNGIKNKFKLLNKDYVVK